MNKLGREPRHSSQSRFELLSKSLIAAKYQVSSWHVETQYEMQSFQTEVIKEAEDQGVLAEAGGVSDSPMIATPPSEQDQCNQSGGNAVSEQQKGSL